MNSKEPTSYHPICSRDSDSEEVTSNLHVFLKQRNTQRRLKLVLVVLSVFILVTNGLWAWLYNQNKSTPSTSSPMQQEAGTVYPPSRSIRHPIYQNTEFNEEGENKQRADHLWHSIFPVGNGVLSLNMFDAKANGLHETTVDPLNHTNGLYIMAGFHTIHCVTVLRNALWHYRLGENQTAPWSHNVHCLDMIRQTLMCNLDTTIMWTWDPETFADGQLRVCKDYWEIHHWASEHAG